MKKISFFLLMLLFQGIIFAQSNTFNVELNGKMCKAISFHARDNKIEYVLSQIKECGWTFASLQAEKDGSVLVCATHEIDKTTPIPILCIGKYDTPDGTYNYESVLPKGQKQVIEKTFKNGKLLHEKHNGKAIDNFFNIAPNVEGVW